MLYRWQPRDALLSQDGHQAVAGTDVIGLAGALVANDRHQPGGSHRVYIGLYGSILVYMGLYMGLHGFMGLYMGLYMGYIWVYI